MPPRAPPGRLAALRPVAQFAAAWALLLVAFSQPLLFNRIGQALREVLDRVVASPDVAQFFLLAYEDLLTIGGIAFFLTLVPATGLAIFGATLRMLARRRVRAGTPDFLDALRRRVASHPRTTRALLALPALAWTLFVLLRATPHLDPDPGNYERVAGPLVLTAWAMYAAARRGQRAFVAPTEAQASAGAPIDDEEIVFDAVAVTRESVAVVTAFSALVLGLPFYVLFALVTTGHEPALASATGRLASFLGYVGFSLGGAYAFQRVSRISVGVDGVHVRGTYRARFFSYREADGVRIGRGGDVEIVRGERVLLRLQLHGDDAMRRDAIVRRISENIARAHEGDGSLAQQLVAASSRDSLARGAAGGGDYRAAVLSRDKLWALLEGPETTADVRVAAASALATAAGDEERARLRVAAERCAEPEMRVALQEIADEELEVPLGAPTRAARH